MRRSAKGFTLVEVTIILLVLVILSGILLPTIERFIDLARYVKAKEDTGMIAAIIELWKVDNCSRWFRWTNPTPPAVPVRLDLMISDATPASTPLLATGITLWDTQYPGSTGTVTVDTMLNQLVIGNPQGGANPYPRPPDLNPVSCGFRGAYISTPVGVDPWGTRYMVNVAFLGPEQGRNLGVPPSPPGPGFNQYDVFVLSAGPDKVVSTPFIVDGVVAGGEDIIALVSGGF